MSEWSDYWEEMWEESWKEAIEDAKEGLGRGAGWDGVLEEAKTNLSILKDSAYLDFCCYTQTITSETHKEHLKSPEWNKIRFEALERDKFRCQDCGNRAKDVHHRNYDFVGSINEIHTCISLCRECHFTRHKKGVL